jgi:hypothetical protein
MLSQTRPYSFPLFFGGMLCGGLLLSCDSWPGLNGNGGFAAGATQVDDTTGDLGSACGSSVTCQSGLTCATAAPNGYCTKNCSTDSDCGNGSCLPIYAWGGMICLKTCTSDQLCRPSYSCQTTGTASVCFTAAAKDGG